MRHLDDAIIEPIVSNRMEEALAALLMPTKSGNLTHAMQAKLDAKRLPPRIAVALVAAWLRQEGNNVSIVEKTGRWKCPYYHL